MVDKIKFVIANETSYLFVVVIIKGILYDFVIRIFWDFGLIIFFII